MTSEDGARGTQPASPPFLSPHQKAQAAFLSAVVLLLFIVLAACLTILRLLDTQHWVIHTLEVRVAIGDVDSAVLRAGRAQSAYLISGSDEFLPKIDAASREIHDKVVSLRELTKDNPQQQELCALLTGLTARRLALVQESVHLRKIAPQDTAGQADLARRVLPLASQLTAIMSDMRDAEQRLLQIRAGNMRRSFIVTVIVLSVAFVLALALFSIQYRFLSAELKAREQAEAVAHDSEESLRRLASRLLQLQDAERRKFSRELHDSLGQYLASVKMNLEMFVTRRDESLLAEAIQLLDQSIGETRTISHLLHPPLLDEAGLASAARWYLEGFSRRSGIAVNIDLPVEDAARLPKPVALGLFRVLQESLTNIHRHSDSTKAEVALVLLPGSVTLRVRDYGKGVAPELLKSFGSKGMNTGVGLAGMSERIRELGGQLNVQACQPGTLISVTLPLREVTEQEQALSEAE